MLIVLSLRHLTAKKFLGDLSDSIDFLELRESPYMFVFVKHEARCLDTIDNIRISADHPLDYLWNWVELHLAAKRVTILHFVFEKVQLRGEVRWKAFQFITRRKHDQVQRPHGQFPLELDVFRSD